MENQSRTLLTIVGIAVLVILGGVIWYMTARTDQSSEFESATTSDRDVSGTPSAQNENIILFAPRVNERVGSPLVIQGEARAFENTVNFRLLDASGEEIAEGFAAAESRTVGEFGRFRGELTFVSEVDQQGTLEVFQISAENGSEIDRLTVPLTITKTAEFIKG